MVHISGQDGLPGQTLQVFFADREGNFWGGYHRGGLVLLRKKTFQTVKRTEELLDMIVVSLVEDRSNAIWMGMSSGSLLRWQDGALENLSLLDAGFNAGDVVSAALPDGRMFLGTAGAGLLVFDQDGFHKEEISPGTTREIRQMLVARDGNLLFASTAGLNLWDGEKITRLFSSPVAESHVLSIAQDSEGKIWFGTADGVLRCWRDGKITEYRPQDGFPSARFWALYADADDTLWIGTMGQGLLRFKNDDFTRFRTANGLASDYVSQIIADERGNLWLGSQAGIMRVPKSTLVSSKLPKDSVPCRLFGRSDGLPTAVMTLEFQPTCLRSHDGNLWFASPKGATWVNPNDIRPVQPPPPVVIERVLADNRACAVAFEEITGKVPNITLDPDVKTLEVIFTSPTFAAPELTRFRYRLNSSDEWTDLDSKRNVIFNGLAAGDYKFQIKAVNCDGLWSLQPAEFNLTVRPHFWQRGSFQSASVLMLVLAAAITARRITHRRMRRKLEIIQQQRQIEQERARIAQDLHDDLGAGLTEISMASDLVENPELSGHESRQYTREIGTRARELVQRLDEIVWAVNPRNDSVASLSSYACEYSQLFLQPLSIEFVLDVQSDLPEVRLNAEQRYNFFLAFKEVINNVARHSKATRFRLAIQAENGELIFVVTDNGCGFIPSAERASSDGLHNIRERISRLGGKCEISSQPGQGTRVVLHVPLANGRGKVKS
jgi:signal transduction histidine kinase